MAFLEDFLLTTSPRDMPQYMDGRGKLSQPPSLLANGSNAGRRKKVPDHLRHASSTTVRQALFPSGPGSYPSENSPLRASGPGHASRNVKVNDDDDLWNGGWPQHEIKRREMCWNTSFPAEYVQPVGTQRETAMQTLAYHEQQLQQQRQQEEQLQRQQRLAARGTDTRKVLKPDESLLLLHKHVMMREGLLAKLHGVIQAATEHREFDISRGNELLHLLLELRDASVEVIERLVEWHLRYTNHPSSPKRSQGASLPVFTFEKANYCVKMTSDLNFLSSVKALGDVLGVDSMKMRQNPFMMPEPLSQRDFSSVQRMPWGELGVVVKCLRKLQQQQQQRKKGRQVEEPDRESDNQVAERVAGAETYLVWCIYNLQPGQDESIGSNTSGDASTIPQPPTTLLSWQKRAEKQLELLSRPLESSSGRAYVMDSSPMMKRKGMLPSLPLSPPKTLTELIDTVHQSPLADGSQAQPELLSIDWNGTTFCCAVQDFEALGSLPAPPHNIITIVTASVLILLSPSDRLPKDLSWTSCRKMLLGGVRLVERLVNFDVASVPEFKWKALVPFLQNDQFQPRALAEVSNAGACLCAWVLAGMLRSREIAANEQASEEDRLELLGELEVDDAESESRSLARTPFHCEAFVGNGEDTARPKSKSSKRVSIGNAEILFINENQPVALTPTPLHSRPTSRHVETPPSLAIQAPAPSMLVRTSPWTFKGVTYFVSFFLEQQRSNEQMALSIKMYEPMSSVESQIFVSEEDLCEDFGDDAVAAFRRREYRDVCELILSKLDRMMGGSRDSARRSGRREDPAANANDSEHHVAAVGATTDETEYGDDSEENGAAPTHQAQLEGESQVFHVGDENEGEYNSSDESDKTRESNNQQVAGAVTADDDQETCTLKGLSTAGLMDEDTAAIKIQCLARQQSAKNTYARLANEQREVAASIQESDPDEETASPSNLEDEKQAAILRIQCAARQKQARVHVERVRFVRERKLDEDERRKRILQRIPTGVAMDEEVEHQHEVPSHSLAAFAEDDGPGEDDQEQEQEEAQIAVLEPEVEQLQELPRPETSMSYASEQFEDDFDA